MKVESLGVSFTIIDVIWEESRYKNMILPQFLFFSETVAHQCRRRLKNQLPISVPFPLETIAPAIMPQELASH